MRVLGRLVLLPLQLVASVGVVGFLVLWGPLHRLVGYVLRGDWCAFRVGRARWDVEFDNGVTRTETMYSDDPEWPNYPGPKYTTVEFECDWRPVVRAWRWIWRPRFVKPKGPTEF